MPKDNDPLLMRAEQVIAANAALLLARERMLEELTISTQQWLAAAEFMEQWAHSATRRAVELSGAAIRAYGLPRPPGSF
jgi:hypothetical protein